MSAREAVARRPASLQRPAGHWLRRRSDRVARWLVLRVLARIRGGELVIVEQGARLTYGRLVPERPLRALLHVRSERFYRQLLRGSIGLCESYMDGLWRVRRPRRADAHRGAQRRRARPLRRALRRCSIPLQRWARWRRNTPGRSRRRHRRPLRPRQRALRAVPGPHDDVLVRALRAARREPRRRVARKLERVCAKLDLRPRTTCWRSAPAGAAWRCTRHRTTAVA